MAQRTIPFLIVATGICLSWARSGLAAPESPPPPTNDATHFVFAVCGDTRDGDDTFRRIISAATADRAAFVIHTGDIVSTGSDSNWARFAELMKGFPFPFFPVAGNHDHGARGLDGFIHWTPGNKEHYSFDWGNVHFTMANDSAGAMTRSELAWIDNDLAATKKPVKIVVHHMPAWNPEGPVYGMSDGNDAFLALLKKHRVLFDLCGHDHVYRKGERDGTTLIVAGGGGAPLYHASDKGGFHHYVRFTVTGANVVFQPVMVPVEDRRVAPTK